ncbi:MAG: sulfonate transporter substrate-binding protein [Herminiimonas sp.]|nr:sulfonate transporter substrate-binding protein [Herminiimonas sp.]
MTKTQKNRLAKRRTLAVLSAATITALTATVSGLASAQDKRTLRIGYQKYGTLTLLKGRGTLDKRLAALGIDVRWTEFPAGPVLLEGLNVGSIDFGTVGEAPPIFAQAAGANLVYVANEPPAPRAEAIVVPKGSPLKSVAELKGRKVALNKGSNVHYLLVRAIEKAGLQYSDITPVYLPPADARAAFERGSVDAWVIWDPFLAAAESQLGARVLADGRGLVSNHQFYLASRPYADKHPDIVRVIIEELVKVDEWGLANPGDAAAVLSGQTGLDAATVALAVERYAYGVKPITPAVIEEQQRIADVFAKLKLIPKPLRVADIVWQPLVAQSSK